MRPDGTARRVISREQWLVHGWDHEGRVILGIKRGPDGKRLPARIDVDSGQERVLGDTGMPAHTVIGCYSLNPPGTAFAVSVGRARGDVWLLKGFPRPLPFWRRMLP